MLKELTEILQDMRRCIPAIQHIVKSRTTNDGADYTKQSYGESVQKAVESIHPRKMRLRVTEAIQETPSTKVYRLTRTDGPFPPFRPGQYVNVFIEIDGIKTSRPYSIASEPGSRYMELAIRDNPSGFAAPYLLNNLKVGSELETTGPAGYFYYEPLIDGNDLVFLAGGSGITPFMSMIRHTAKHSRNLKINLLYGSRSPKDVIYKIELNHIAAEFAGFKYSLVISEPPKGYKGSKGFLDAKNIKKLAGDIAGKTYYICGPDAMYECSTAALSELGVPKRKIRRELYGPPNDVTKEPGWPKEISAKDNFQIEVVNLKTITASAGEPLMNSLERNGLVIPAVCRSGACSACRIRLVSGKVFMPEHVWLRESDRNEGYIHACMSYPISALKIQL